MKYRKIYIVAVLAATSVTLSAQPRVYDLFDLVPGEAHPEGVKLESSGGLVDQYRAPIPDGSPYSMFHDYAVQLLKADGTIYAVHASRAYTSHKACKRDEEDLRTRVEEQFPSYTYDKYEIAYSSSESELVVEMECSRLLGAPFYELGVRFFNQSSANRLIKEFQELSDS